MSDSHPGCGLPHASTHPWTLKDAVSTEPTPGQGSLFDVAAPVDDQRGFRGPVAAGAAGITYRQLDYRARTGLVEPSIRPAAGSGTHRLYSFRDVLVLQIVKRLLNIHAALATLCAHGTTDLAAITLISDGSGVYLCHSDAEVIDLVRGGQGVFGIAIGQVWTDVEATLTQLPTETTHPSGDAARERQATGRQPALRVVS